jgi:hypothetical protein
MGFYEYDSLRYLLNRYFDFSKEDCEFIIEILLKESITLKMIQNGLINDDILKSIGITKLGHRLALLELKKNEGKVFEVLVFVLGLGLVVVLIKF